MILEIRGLCINRIGVINFKKNSDKKRQSNIDVLRVIFMLMVALLHALGMEEY